MGYLNSNARLDDSRLPLPCPFRRLPYAATASSSRGRRTFLFRLRCRLFLFILLVVLFGGLGHGGPGLGVLGIRGCCLCALSALRRGFGPLCGLRVLGRGRRFRRSFGLVPCAAGQVLEQADTGCVQRFLIFDRKHGRGGRCVRVVGEASLPHHLSILLLGQLEVGYVDGFFPDIRSFVAERVFVFARVQVFESVEGFELPPDAGYTRVRRVLGCDAIGAHVVVNSNHAEMSMHA
jgi:hypothetical protein